MAFHHIDPPSVFSSDGLAEKFVLDELFDIDPITWVISTLIITYSALIPDVQLLKLPSNLLTILVYLPCQILNLLAYFLCFSTQLCILITLSMLVGPNIRKQHPQRHHHRPRTIFLAV